MFRWLTAGESHGEALVGIVEGVPSGVEITSSQIGEALARRRLGYGRGARMKFEQDVVRVLGGVRLGKTLGGPVAIEVGNTEWPKWSTVMSSDPVDPSELTGARAEVLTRPRPGHADLVGMQKYGLDDARNVLERSSARETAMRVALGRVAEAFLDQAAGIRLVAHTVAIGSVSVPDDGPLPAPDDTTALDADPARCFDPETSARMVEEVDACQRDGDTLGGIGEVVAYGLPPGLGTHVQWDRRLDARLAAALMSIQSVKAVEVGDGFRTAARRGSVAHDEIVRGADSAVHRASNRAGGVEGGMSNGEPLRVRAAFKPISTVPRALQTIDTATGEAATAIHQRSDVCAVVPGAVVAQAMVALVLAEAVLEKFGGDSLGEVRRNIAGYLDSIPAPMRTDAAQS